MLELKVLLVLVAVGVLIAFTSRRTRVRPRKIDLAKTPDSDAVLARLAVEVDAVKIRTIRDTRGPISAIKEIRADCPGTSLADAKRYVESLD